MATHSRILVWKIPQIEEPVGYSPGHCKEVDMTEQLHLHLTHLLVAQRLKHLPAMWETWVQSLGREHPLEKETATHSSTLAWGIPGQRNLVGCRLWSRTELDTTEAT